MTRRWNLSCSSVPPLVKVKLHLHTNFHLVILGWLYFLLLWERTEVCDFDFTDLLSSKVHENTKPVQSDPRTFAPAGRGFPKSQITMFFRVPQPIGTAWKPDKNGHWSQNSKWVGQDTSEIQSRMDTEVKTVSGGTGHIRYPVYFKKMDTEVKIVSGWDRIYQKSSQNEWTLKSKH